MVTFSPLLIAMLMIPALGIPALIVMTRRLLRRFSANGPQSEKNREKTDEARFVTNAFQELVIKLRANEKELERLQKLAEARANRIEDLSRNILESIPSGVVSFDPGLTITMANSSAQRILELPPGLDGKKAGEVFGKELTGIIEAGAPVERCEIAYTSASGKKLWLGFSLTSLIGDSGEPGGRILVFTDLTGLKILERQAELRKRLASLGEIAAGVAHELRNPMAVIAGYVKMLEKQHLHHADAKILKTISKEVAAMDAIINGFLAFARPKPPETAPMTNEDLKLLLETCIAQSFQENPDIRTVLEMDGQGFTIEADDVQLKQVFVNIARNSAQAMGGAGTFTVRAERSGGEAIISLSDTGHGIPEEMKEKIFLPFYTTKEEGTGLGLAIAHGIIESHGGNIEAESAPGKTTFRIRLPLSSRRIAS
ncbi:MAG: ATP-binding protein [Actinomycetota bacterium]|nr:ATP-binding protein [Actinomycetota bacterium]